MDSNKLPPLLGLPYDVLLAIIANMSDPMTLGNLLMAYPVLQAFIENDFSFILRMILANNLDNPELYRYVFAIMTARNINIQKSLHYFLTYFTGGCSNTALLPGYVPRSVDTLRYMSEVVNAVDFYLLYGKRLWDNAMTNQRHPSDYPPATDLVIRTGLLRLQLYAEIFHQPLDNSDLIDNWDADLLLLQDYWGFFESEPYLRLCKFLYAAIAVSVGHEIEHKHLPAVDAAPDTVCLRGISQTKRFMLGQSYTSFGLSYVRRFVQKNVSMMELLDSASGAWSSHWAIKIVFLWEDGPHGGLGVTRKHQQYLYSGVPYEGHAGYLSQEAIFEDDDSEDEGYEE